MSKKIEPITFRHPYYKLSNEVRHPTFTTIRGKAQFKRRKVGDVVPIETPTENFNAIIVSLELKRVRDMTLEFLKADAEYPGCTISKHEHFVNLLNSFRAPAWTRCTLDSELTIITLKRQSLPPERWHDQFNPCIKELVEEQGQDSCNCSNCRP